MIHVAFNYVVHGGQRVRKDTKTHQDRWLAIDPDLRCLEQIRDPGGTFTCTLTFACTTAECLSVAGDAMSRLGGARRRSRTSRRILVHGVAVIVAVAGFAVAGRSPSPSRLLADTPSGNPLASRLCGEVRAVPGLGALQAANKAPALFARGISGAGTTIAVILPYANSWITADVATYSQRYRLPVPDVQVIDWHQAEAAHPGDHAQAGGAQEGALDLEMAHVLAPGARLIYLEVPPGSGDAYLPALT